MRKGSPGAQVKRILAALLFVSAQAFAATQTTNPGINHPWPLGQITVTTAGSPVKLTSLVSPGNPQCSQLWIKNNSSTATVYLMAGNVAKDSTFSQVVYYFAPGEYIFISATALGSSVITAGNYYLDASANGATAVATCWQGAQ